MANREFFICFEGLDGVGKTTQIGLLHGAIESVLSKAPNRTSENGKVLDNIFMVKSSYRSKQPSLFLL